MPLIFAFRHGRLMYLRQKLRLKQMFRRLRSGLQPTEDPTDAASPGRDAFEAALRAIGERAPDATEYQALSQISLVQRLTAKLRTLDPFSAEYKATVLQIYHDLRGSDRPYVPEDDEKSGMALPQNVLTEVSPWSFRDTGLVAEFLLSWGQIMRALALPAGSNAKILEYGSGSGQLLLFLARLGLRVSAVDIDAASLELLRARASVMRLDVRTEQAAFGEGFGDETFDRIIFFEAFHHAIDFGPLLHRLRERLSPGGKLILCGEPVVGDFAPAVPYPLGPRLDGLSVFCIRRHGWMELGFTEPFLIEALHRHGWLVDVTALPACGRATTYVARPYAHERVELGEGINLGRHEAGWESPGGGHRWTRGGVLATFPLPDQAGPSRVTITAGNPFPRPVRVELYDGDRFAEEVTIPAGLKKPKQIVLGPLNGAFLGVRCKGQRPTKVWRGSADRRSLGVMVHSIEVAPTQPGGIEATQG